MTRDRHRAWAAAALLVVAGAGAAPAVSGVEADAAGRWRAALDQPFGALLTAAGEGDLPAWPEVVSGSFATPVAAGEAAGHESYRQLAVVLLERFERHLEEPAAGAADLSETLALRDLIAARPGYVNLVLADALNRAAYVELAKRIVAAGAMSPPLDAELERLRSFEPQPGELLALVRAELGPGFPADEIDPTAEPRQLYRALLEALGPRGTEDGYLADLAKIGEVEAYGLLAETDLSWFLLRLQLMDYRTQIVLPMLAEYVRRAEGFTPEDGYDKVRATLGLDERKRRAYDSTLHRTPATVTYDVTRLIEEVRTGEIDDLPIFGARPVAKEPGGEAEETGETSAGGREEEPLRG